MRLFRRGSKQVKIRPNQVFLHDRDRFEPGQEYKVEINLARYFARNGWLEGVEGDPFGAVTLEIDDGEIGQESRF